MPLPVSPTAAESTAPGSAAYLRAATEDVLGWSDPKRRLREALAENDFLLYAQHIRALKPELIARPCCEILLRLREEEDNMLPPGGFFPVAEALGMIEDIDRWVVANTVAWCAALADDPTAPVYCVNLSTDAVRNPEFAKHVRTLIQAAAIHGKHLCFEICEADIIAHPQDVRGFIGALRPQGCRFTLDGFGSTQMSFTHLRDLPINYLKIDGSIIRNILRNPGDLARARAITATCKKLDIRSIAGHVETPEILAKLTEIGCDYAQGFGVALPGPLNVLGSD